MKDGLFEIRINFDGVPIVHEKKMRNGKDMHLAVDKLDEKFGKGRY